MHDDKHESFYVEVCCVCLCSLQCFGEGAFPHDQCAILSSTNIIMVHTSCLHENLCASAPASYISSHCHFKISRAWGQWQKISRWRSGANTKAQCQKFQARNATMPKCQTWHDAKMPNAKMPKCQWHWRRTYIQFRFNSVALLRVGSSR